MVLKKAWCIWDWVWVYIIMPLAILSWTLRDDDYVFGVVWPWNLPIALFLFIMWIFMLRRFRRRR